MTILHRAAIACSTCFSATPLWMMKLTRRRRMNGCETIDNCGSEHTDESHGSLQARCRNEMFSINWFQHCLQQLTSKTKRSVFLWLKKRRATGQPNYKWNTTTVSGLYLNLTRKVRYHGLSSLVIKNDSHSMKKRPLIRAGKRSSSSKYHYALVWIYLRRFSHRPPPAFRIMWVCCPLCITSHLPPDFDILILVRRFTLISFTFSAFD